MLQLPLSSQVNFNQFSLLDFFGSLISLSPMIAWTLAAIVGVVFIIFSFVLSYHWKQFGFEVNVMKKAAVIYFSVSAIFLTVMYISLFLYIKSL